MNTTTNFIKEHNSHKFFNNLTNENYINLTYPKGYELPDLKWMSSIDLRHSVKNPDLNKYDFSKLKGAAKPKVVPIESEPENDNVEIDEKPLYNTNKCVQEAKDSYILSHIRHVRSTYLCNYNKNMGNIYVFDTWEEVVEKLKDWYNQEGYKPTRKEVDNKDKKALKRSSILINGALYRDYGLPRSNRNTVCWNRIALLDIDKHDFTADNLEQSLKDKWGQYDYVVYNTASSSKESPKFRVVLPLNKPVYNEKIKHFWYSLNTEFGNISDGQRKDPTGIYYIPGKYPDAYSFFFENKGKHIDVDYLMKKHKYVEKNMPSKPDVVITKTPANDFYRTYMEIDQWGNDWTKCVYARQNSSKIYEYISLGKQDGTGRYEKWFTIACAICCSAVRGGLPLQQYKYDIIQLMKNIEFEARGENVRTDYNLEIQNAIDFALGKI